MIKRKIPTLIIIILFLISIYASTVPLPVLGDVGVKMGLSGPSLYVEYNYTTGLVTTTETPTLNAYAGYSLYKVNLTGDNSSLDYIKCVYPMYWSIINISNTTVLLSSSDYLTGSYNATHSYLLINSTTIGTYGISYIVWFNHTSPITEILVQPVENSFDPTSLTVELVIRFDELNISPNRDFMYKSDGYKFELDYNDYPNGGQIEWGPKIGVTFSIVAEANLSQTGWYHLVGVLDWNGTHTNGAIYINGSLVDSGSTTAKIIDTDYMIHLGGDGFVGAISLFRFYRRALTSSEIQTNFQSAWYGNVSYVTNGLNLYLDFTGNSLTDLSGNGNSVSVYGTVSYTTSPYDDGYAVYFDGSSGHLDISDTVNKYSSYFDPGDEVRVRAKLQDPNGNLLSGVNTTLDVGLGQYTQVKDKSGLGNHGTIYGGASTVGSPYDDGVALKFDGSNDYVVSSVSGLVFNWTIEVMINPQRIPSSGSDGYIQLWGGVATQNEINFYQSSSSLYNFTITVYDSAGIGNTLGTIYKRTQNEWIHFIITYNTTHINAFVNGQYVKSAYYPNHNWSITEVQLGRARTSSYAMTYISVTRVYLNKTLTTLEVTQNYQSIVYGNVSYVSDGLVLYFEFGEYTSPTAYKDLSGNGNDGVAYGGVERVLTPYGWAWNTSSMSYGWIKVIHNIDFTSGFTVSVLVNPSNFYYSGGNAGNGRLLGQADGYYGSGGWHIQLMEGNTAMVRYRNSTTRGSFNIGNAYTLNSWNFITLKYNVTSWMYYLNTSLLATHTSLFNFTQSTNDFGVMHSPGGDTYVAGVCAAVFLYNRSLSTGEITQNYYSIVYHNTSFVRDGLVLYLTPENIPTISLGSYTSQSNHEGYASYTITLPNYDAPINLQISVDSGNYQGLMYRWIYATRIDLLSFSTNATRVSTGKGPLLSGSLRVHMTGETNIDGLIFINGTQITVTDGSFTYEPTQSSVGLYRYMITRVKYQGIDTVQTWNGSQNYLDIIYDQIEIYGVSWTLSGSQSATVSWSIRFKYDNTIPTQWMVYAQGNRLNQTSAVLTLPSYTATGSFQIYGVWAIGTGFNITSSNTVTLYYASVKEPRGTVFQIIEQSGNQIISPNWDDTNADLYFNTSGTVEVYVGTWGQPQYVDINNAHYTDWSYNTNLNKVIINNVASKVLLDWIPPSGGGGGGSLPTDDTPTPNEEGTPKPPTAIPIPLEFPRIFYPGEWGLYILLGLIALGVVSFYYRKYAEDDLHTRLRRYYQPDPKTRRELEKKIKKYFGGG